MYEALFAKVKNEYMLELVQNNGILNFLDANNAYGAYARACVFALYVTATRIRKKNSDLKFKKTECYKF